MFHLLQNNKIIGSSSSYLSATDCDTIERDFTEEEMKKIELGYEYDGENFTPTLESMKSEMIATYNTLASDLRDLRLKHANLVAVGKTELAEQVDVKIATIENQLLGLEAKAIEAGMSQEEINLLIIG